MRSLYLALIFCFFIVGNFGVPIAWNPLSPGGDWNNATNWLPAQVPGVSDTATFIAGITVTVSANTQVDQLVFAGNVKLLIQNNAQFTVNNNVTQVGAITIQTEVGSTFSCPNYFIFSGESVQFINFGTTTLNPQVNSIIAQGTIQNYAQANNVVFSGSKANLINANFYIPTGFQFAQVAQTFSALVAGGTITFAYPETIPTNGWTFNNNIVPSSVVFSNGANINGPVSVAVQTVGATRPVFTFAGSINVGNNVNLDVQPVIGFTASIVSFNGASVSFNLNSFGLVFSTSALQGTSTITFTNTNNVLPALATFNRAITISSNIIFSGIWTFDGAVTATFTNAFNLNFNLTLAATSLTFLQPTTLSTGLLLFGSGAGNFKFTNGLVSNNGITFNGLSPVLDCTVGNNNLFQITGTSALSFPLGLVVNGCTVSSTATLNIQNAVTTNGGNTTLPAVPTTVFTGTIGFSAVGNPTNGLYSIVLGGQVTVPNGQVYSANNVEVILPSTNVFQVSDNAQLINNNQGLFTLNGGIGFGSGCSVGALTAFPSGNSVINGAFRVNWGGNIILRNTNLGGTGDVWFTGNLVAVKGQSTINNPNFKFKGGVVVNYLWDQVLPNSGCQVLINTAGNTGSRTIEGGQVTAGSNAGIVFDDLISFNVTTTVSGSTNTPPGSVTFRTNLATNVNITTTQVVTFDGNIYFNNTNFHLVGIGSFAVTGNAFLYLQGGLNFPAAVGDALFNINSAVYIGVTANSTLGQTVTLNAGLTTDDLDNNPNTASTKLTLYSLANQARSIQGPYNLGSSLTFGGNVNVMSASTINSIGTIEIQGNTISLSASPTWNNNLALTGGAVTVTALTANTLTLADQNPTHGLNIPATFTVLSPATVSFSSISNIIFQAGASIGGNGAVSITNSNVGNNGAVTIAPQSLSLTNANFFGTGAFTLSPSNGNLVASTSIYSTVPLTYTGNQLTLTSNTIVSSTVSFTSNPITFTGSRLTVDVGSSSVNTRWVVNNAGIVFSGVVTIASTGSFGGAGLLTWNNTLILAQTTTISNPVQFGLSQPNYLVTVANGGFSLILTSTSVNVLASVVSNGGSIVSTSPLPNFQLISGGGIISSDWTFSNTVQLGKLNVTGARTLNFNLVLTNGQTTYFTDGVTFNGGTFVPLTVSDAPVLSIQNYFTTNANTLLAPQITLLIYGNTFNFQGSNVLTINGTVNCSSTVTFAQNVIFGWLTSTSGNPIYLKFGTSGWFAANNGIQLQLWRTSIVVETNVTAAIYPSIIFGLPGTVNVVASTSASITFYGNLNLIGTGISGSGNANFGVITIVSAQNNTISGFNLFGTLTFNSTTTPFVESTFSPASTLSQTLILNGPVKLPQPSFGPLAQILGPARVAITDSLTVSSAFTFGAPVQLYVTAAFGTFTFTLSGTQTYLTFGVTPSLFNPLGLTPFNGPNFIVNSGSPYNILKFNLNSALNIANLGVNSGVLQLSQSTTNSLVVNVASNATLWIDNNNFNANQVIFNQNPDGTSPSFYQLTVSSLTPPAITTGAVVYKGSASLVVVNFNWNGQAITGITANSANGPTANFASVTGTPGYQYQSNRAGNNVQFTRSANPSVSPFPTQSNGPSPAVSASSFVSFNIALFALIVVFFIFN